MKSDVLPAEFVISEKISIDYINSVANLKKVFPRHFREASLRRFSVDRERLVDRLLEYNSR
ncbi:hypothetical protein KAH85_03545, partial [Candidatus Bathyarchaeota archaeon]|nr:hypothetical protein [Candidatus Bathyarchaeota archaeon]